MVTAPFQYLYHNCQLYLQKNKRDTVPKLTTTSNTNNPISTQTGLITSGNTFPVFFGEHNWCSFYTYNLEYHFKELAINEYRNQLRYWRTFIRLKFRRLYNAIGYIYSSIANRCYDIAFNITQCTSAKILYSEYILDWYYIVNKQQFNIICWKYTKSIWVYWPMDICIHNINNI